MTKPDIKKRKKVLQSTAFRKWWAARQDEPPVPADPYRAYMIDLSLHAHIGEKKPWENEPNRLDMIDVDYPFAGAPNYYPARKPRQRHREAPSKSPTLPKDPLSRKLTLEAEQMAIHYGQPAPTVVIDRGKGAMSSYARTGIGALPSGNLVRVGGGLIKIGVKGKGGSVQSQAAAFHEVGHVVHAQKSFKHDPLGVGITPYGQGGEKGKYSDEQAAWKFAAPFIQKLPSKGKRPAANWVKAYALNSYRRGAKFRGTPLKISKSGQITVLKRGRK